MRRSRIEFPATWLTPLLVCAWYLYQQWECQSVCGGQLGEFSTLQPHWSFLWNQGGQHTCAKRRKCFYLVEFYTFGQSLDTLSHTFILFFFVFETFNTADRPRRTSNMLFIINCVWVFYACIVSCIILCVFRHSFELLKSHENEKIDNRWIGSKLLTGSLCGFIHMCWLNLPGRLHVLLLQTLILCIAWWIKFSRVL